ncbi:hypothetical protein CEXT_37831 [Caerostris extrusa]|uniref:Uncharacterized protein n=1 Tax=Caerostris extrusa TaxID=172846 RepID=A0AAV4XFW2_CAEEX|nr:hypothetical protein CEXT_37831 [Caerostris extrusa]
MPFRIKPPLWRDSIHPTSPSPKSSLRFLTIGLLNPTPTHTPSMSRQINVCERFIPPVKSSALSPSRRRPCAPVEQNVDSGGAPA